MGKRDKADRKSGWRLLRLWILVSGLWTVATLLRIDRVWVPHVGWRRALEGPWIWISLILPPVMFAIAIAALHAIGASRK